MVYLMRVQKFNAAHKLWVENWTAEKNAADFGKCANKNFHGLNFQLYVTIAGKPDLATGFIMYVNNLGKLIGEKIIEHVDYSNLNLDIPFIPKGVLPTVENLSFPFWDLLESGMNNCLLHSIKLIETESIFAECFEGK